MYKKAASGFFYTAIGKYSNTLVQLIVNAILSRILSPKDYGVVAVCQVFILFFGVLNDAGMGPAIIQNKGLSNKDYSVLFNYSIIFASLSALAYGSLGYLIATIYQQQIYVRITWAQSLYVFLAGANVVPTALLNSRQQFKRLNYSLLIGNSIGGIVGVISAYSGLGIYSLVTSVSASSFTIFVLNFMKSKLVLSRSFEMGPLKSIWNFAKNQFGYNFLNFFSRNSDSLLIGKFLGASALGNYNKAYQLLLMPNSILLGVVNPVLQPLMKDYQDDVSYIRQVFLAFIRYLVLLSFPLSIFLSFSARDVIFFLFGNQWGAAVFPFSVLSLTVWIQVASACTPAFYQARNKTSYLLLNGYQSALFIVGSIVFGIVFGNINSLSISLSIGFLISFIINFYILCKKVIMISLARLFREFSIGIQSALLLFLLIKFSTLFTEQLGMFGELLIRGLLFILSIAGVFIVNGEFKHLEALRSHSK